MVRIRAHLETLAHQPVSDVAGAARLAREARQELPETGRPADELLALVFDRLLSKSFNTASPGYLAYIPGGGLPAAAVGDLIADSINRYVGVWLAAPGLVELEANVVRWFCQMVGYPAAARGFLTTGGSLANLSAVVTARSERLGEEFRGATFYASDQIHHSLPKAARLAGLPAASLRSVPTDDLFRIRIDALREQIAADRRRGARPFLLVASAGTVNTGAVDDLETLAAVAAEENLWLHVDGAYGGFFVLTERGRRRLTGIERADSVSLDPHKSLFLPYGTGCLLARDGGALRRAHQLTADYMPALQDDPERIDFCEISPELSRDFRGLRVWLPLALHGAAAFRRALDEKLDLAAWAAHELEGIPGVEVVAKPQLSIVAFWLRRPGVDAAATDRLNRELLARINARQRVFLTATLLRGRFVIRICVLHFRTHLDRMRMAIEDVRRAAAEL